MMKRMMTLILALMMLVLPAVSGAEESEYASYEHPEGLYSFLYPADWNILSRESFEAAWDAAIEMSDEDLQAQLEQARVLIEENGMIILNSPDGVDNINMACQAAGMELTAEILLNMSPVFCSQLEAAMDGIAFPVEPYLVELGEGRQALLIEYLFTMMDIEMYGMQAYVAAGSNVYIFTLTTRPDDLSAAETLGFILGSAQLN